MIGILIVSHGAFGEALIHSREPRARQARRAHVRQLGVCACTTIPKRSCRRARDLVRAARRTATACWCSPTSSAPRPATSPSRLLEPGSVEGVSGVILPMLIRALTYRDERARRGACKARSSGGAEGVVHMNTDRCCDA